MPFSFLNPWFWLGAFSVAAPVWLHLRRKKETNILSFSAVRFLEDQPEPRRTPLHITKPLLFALRVFAFVSIVAAFAWPYLRGANTQPVRESRVYILDNSLSRQANDAFARDRSRLLDELSNKGSDIQLAVVELRSTPRILCAFGDRRETAKERVLELKPSFERGSYLAAFRVANSLLENGLGEQRRIVLLGDNQENQWNEDISTPPFLRNVQLELPKVPSHTLPNLSLSEPRAQRVYLGEKSMVHFSIKVHHIGEAKTASVVVRSNGQSVFNRTVELESQPETILLQAQWEADASAWLQGEAAIEGAPDALPADNRVFFSLPPVIEGKVALLAQSPYLRLALSPEIMRGRWFTRALDPTALGRETTAEMDDVFCLETSYLQSSDARKLLSKYFTNGRGVLLLVNRNTPTIDECLRELGFEPEGIAREAKVKTEMFQFVFSNHPIFRPFLSPDYGNLMDIKVFDYAPLRATAAMPLIFSESGAGLFFQGTKFPGKLFVSAFGMEREQSSWPIHQTFIPFLDLTLQAARSEDPSPASFEPSEMATVQFPATLTAKEAVLREDGRELARAPIEHGRAQLRMPGKPGPFSVTCDDHEQVEKMLSVNPSPKESQLVFTDSPAALKAWQWPLQGIASRSPKAPARTQVRLAGVLQQRVWWWMVLGGLLALLLEMTLAEPRKETR